MLLAAPGRGGDALNGPYAEIAPFFRTVDFSAMATPALVVAGDKDDSRHFTDVGPQWHADPYTLAPGPKTLLTLFGAEHGLGGIAGYDAAETTDENPDMGRGGRAADGGVPALAAVRRRRRRGRWRARH